MLLALALSAAVSGHVLRDRAFILTLPPSSHVAKAHVNFETDSYSIRDVRDREIVSIVAGGGSYDLQGYRRFCLNGSVAWFQDSGSSGSLVVGQPGMNAVSVSYGNLDPVRLRMARRITASLRLVDARTPCGSSRRSYPTRS